MKVLIASMALLFCAAAATADIVDQQQTQTQEYWSSIPYGNEFSQAFIPSASNISGASVYTSSAYGGSGTIEMSIYTSDPYYGASPIASGQVSASGGQWADAFWSPVSVTPGNTYYLNFKMVSGNLGATYGYYDPYPSGNIHWYGGDRTDGYDASFKTWYAVPAPGSLALLGLGGLAATRRRRA